MAILELEPPCIIKFELIPPSKPNFCNFAEFQATKMSQNSMVSVNLLMSLKSLLITIPLDLTLEEVPNTLTRLVQTSN